VVVYDRDQQAAGAIYRLYRRVRVLGQVSRSAPLSVDRAVGRRALLSYAAEDAGAPTPRLRALIWAGPEASVLAYEHHGGRPLAQRDTGCSDAELSQIWEAAGRLHAHKVTHRGLTADRILLTGDGQAMLLDPGDGDVAASDLQIRLDVAQLIAELALAVGPDRVAGLAVEKMSAGDLVAVVSVLQPVALARPTGKALRRRRDVLPALRTRLLAAVPGGEVTPARLERIRLRLLTLVAAVAAVYLLAGELGRANLRSVLREADWRWTVVALALSAATYVGAGEALIGFVAGRLSFRRTLLAQLASSFVTLVTPAAVGGATLNIRYLQRQKISAAAAAASVGVAQVVAFVLHVLLILVFAAIAAARAANRSRRRRSGPGSCWPASSSSRLWCWPSPPGGGCCAPACRRCGPCRTGTSSGTWDPAWPRSSPTGSLDGWTRKSRCDASGVCWRAALPVPVLPSGRSLTGLSPGVWGRRAGAGHLPC
jgi:glycosyltransferase 2 family protein